MRFLRLIVFFYTFDDFTSCISPASSTSNTPYIPVLPILASISFFFIRAFLFWNQLYTFASFMGPNLASSSVICVRNEPLGVPIPVAYISSNRASCVGVGFHRWPPPLPSLLYTGAGYEGCSALLFRVTPIYE